MKPSDTPVGTDPVVAFTTAAAALVDSDDTLGIVTQLLLDATAMLGADGAGLVIARADGDLELLSSTSHRTQDLELFQLQADTGPCVDAIRTGAPVTATTPEKIAESWPPLVTAFRATGFGALNAVPMRWHGQTIGALNFFWNSPHDSTEQESLIRGYADMATIAIVHTEHVSTAQVGTRARQVLSRRHVIEQAKGVLSYRDGVDMQTAYETLLRTAAREQVSLSTAATDIVARAGGATVAPEAAS